MKQIGVRFTDKHVLKVADLVDATGTDQSQVIRAALQIGLVALFETEKDKRAEEVLINDLKARN